MNKLVFVLIVIILFCAILLISCTKSDPFDVNNDTKEWISPDGVHYWYWKIYAGGSSWSYVLAPRYDYEGNLVKETREPRN